MSKQHHFVVYYDTEAHGFYPDEESAMFHDGTIWNTETNEWSSRTADDEDFALDERIYKALDSMVEDFNCNRGLPEEGDLTWSRGEVIMCDGCNQPMIPNLSTWDEEDGGGCGWSCTSYYCTEFTGGEIEAEDLIALGVAPWIAHRMADLATAVLDKE